MANTYNFSDVFISYSRKDATFAKHIGETLKHKGYEIWADWEDIPQTVEWWNEIKAGIAAANSFIFIISPSSVTSSICQDEIAYAADNNKRIIPILYHKLSDADLEQAHSAIKTHNWLVFDDSDTSHFEKSLQQLINVLTMDVNYLRLHTRYLVRAREWEEHNKNQSYLLRGTDASDADYWIKDSVGKTPSPLELHHAFIEASRHQMEQDELLKQQQRTIQLVDRTTWPPFWTTLVSVVIYFWFTYPNELNPVDRLTLALGGGGVGGILVAAMALYADELVRVRFENQLVLRASMSLLYSSLFGIATCGLLQVIYFDVPISFPSMIIGGVIFSSGFLIRATFKLKGWQAILPTVLGIVASATLTMRLGDNFQLLNMKPIFYFENWNQYWFVGVFSAVLISIGAYGWPLWETIRDWRNRQQIESDETHTN